MAALFSLVQTLLSLNKCNQISCCLCLKPHAIHSAFCYKFLEHKFMIFIKSVIKPRFQPRSGRRHHLVNHKSTIDFRTRSGSVYYFILSKTGTITG